MQRHDGKAYTKKHRTGKGRKRCERPHLLCQKSEAEVSLRIMSSLRHLGLMDNDVVGQLHLGSHLALRVVGHHDLHLLSFPT